ITTMMFFSFLLPYVNSFYINEQISSVLSNLIFLVGNIFYFWKFIKRNYLGNGKIRIKMAESTANKVLFLLWIFFPITIIISQIINISIPFNGVAILIYITLFYFVIIPQS